jgi:hypothetical protein
MIAGQHQTKGNSFIRNERHSSHNRSSGHFSACDLVGHYAWNSVDVEMSVHGYVAMILGIIFSLVVGCGLMALVFYSNRRGYDEPPDLNR